VDETKKLAEAMIARAINRGDPSGLAQVSGLLRFGPGKEHKVLMDLAVEAAEAMVEVTGGKDAGALANLASVYADIGDKRAREVANKARAAAAVESAETQRAIEQQLRKVEEKKDKK